MLCLLCRLSWDREPPPNQLVIMSPPYCHSFPEPPHTLALMLYIPEMGKYLWYMRYWVRLCVGYACIQQPNHTPTWSPGKTMAAQTIRTQTVLGESGNFSVLTKGKWDEGGAIRAEWLIFLFGLRFDENSCFQLILNSVHNFNFVKYFCFFKAVEYFLLISEWRKSLLPHQMVQVLSLKNLWSFSLKLYPRDITNWGKKKISLEDRRFKSSPYFMHFIASEFIQNSPEVGEWVGNVYWSDYD